MRIPFSARSGLAVFLGALLLFLVQSIVAKRLLPWFGGAPAVWTTCMLFFQAGLLLAYAYAHALCRLAPRRQRDVHLALLGAAVLLLGRYALGWPSPITPDETWKPDPAAAPVPLIVSLLAASVGIPYLALGATGPLVQSWWSRLRPGIAPYRLFALSNLGSLLGLLAYPLILEPTLSVLDQGWVWTAGFVFFAVAMASCAWPLAALPAIPPSPARALAARPTRGRHLLWFCLSVVTSTLLLAITNQLCQDLAVIPFLWILPLALYLLSFVLCFERERWACRPVWLAAVLVAVPACVYALFRGTDLAVGPQVAIFCGALFAYCMACHGELARNKPAPDHLTAFYLTVAAGGAAGGIFTGLLAPLLFPGYWELHLALLAGAALLVARLLLDPAARLNRGPAAGVWSVRVSAGIALASVALTLAGQVMHDLRAVELVRRGFFGRLAVTRERLGEAEWRKLRHGGTVHGAQFTDPARRREPTTYYGPASGVGLALRRHPKRQRGEPLHVGVVGLGVGTLAAYLAPADVARVYEINADVIALSGGRQPVFTFLRDAPGALTIRLGDARLVLEDEPPQGFDVLVLDAFSSDAIPVHLLTMEAMALYLRHLGPGGVLAVHVSNKSLDLKPVVRGVAGLYMLQAVFVESAEQGPLWASDWILLARQTALFEDPEVKAAAVPLALDAPDLPVWTDDFSNLLGVVRWR